MGQEDSEGGQNRAGESAGWDLQVIYPDVWCSLGRIGQAGKATSPLESAGSDFRLFRDLAAAAHPRRCHFPLKHLEVERQPSGGVVQRATE